MRFREIIEATTHVPKVFFHGTSLWAWQEIQSTNQMEDDGKIGAICFTESRRVAEDFARFACLRQDEVQGVVIKFDGQALARDFSVERYYDTEATKNPLWKITDEQEWRVNLSAIPNIMRYVLGEYEVHRDSHDDPANGDRVLISGAQIKRSIECGSMKSPNPFASTTTAARTL